MSPAEREAWLRCCDAEHDNFRAAIHYLIATGDAEWALRLGGALFRFWEQRDHLTEGCETLARVLAHARRRSADARRGPARSTALRVLADICRPTSDGAERLSHEACAIYRAVRRHPGRGHDDGGDGVAGAAARPLREATSLFGETVTLWEQLGDATAVELARSNMAHAAKSGRQVRSGARPARAGGWRHRRNGATCAASPRRSTGSATSPRRTRPRRGAPLSQQSLAKYRRDRRSLGNRRRARRSRQHRPAGRRLRRRPTRRSGRRCRRSASSVISAAWRGSSKCCRRAPAASRATATAVALVSAAAAIRTRIGAPAEAARTGSGVERDAGEARAPHRRRRVRRTRGRRADRAARLRSSASSRRRGGARRRQDLRRIVRIDHPPHGGDTVRRHAQLARVLADGRLVGAR